MKTKRFLAVLLTLTMIIGMLPIMANAQTAEVLYGENADSLTNSGTLESAFSSSSANYIKLQSNVTLTDWLYVVETEKTVDLNGYTITAAEGCGVFYIMMGGLDLIDTATETKGKVTASNFTINVVYDGVLNIGNSNENSGGFTIESESGQAIYVAGGSVNVNKSFTAIGITGAIYNEGNFNGNNIPFHFVGKILNAGTISQLNATGYAEENAIMMDNGSLHITGGTYKGKNRNGIYMLGGEVKLEGGTFEGENTAAIYIASSSEATYADLLGEACYYTDGESDTEITSEEALALASKLTVAHLEGVVASVTTSETTNYYTSISDAIRAAQDSEGSTLKLLDDINTGDTSTYVYSGKFTIDLNGKTWQSSSTVLYIQNNANVTIDDSSSTGEGTLYGTNTSMILLWDTAVLNLVGGTIEGFDNVISMEPNGIPTQAQFVMSGGTLKADLPNAIIARGKSVTISGGTIEGEIQYLTGEIDLSGHDNPTGILIYTSDPLPENPTIKLPKGYVLLERYRNNVVTTLTTWTDYIVGECDHGGENATYDNGICTICGYVCEHNTFEGDKCTVCGYVLENTIVEYDKDTRSAKVTVKEAGTYSLIFAKYGEGNRFDEIDIVECNLVKGENMVPQELKDFTLGAGDKIMLWKDMTNLVPLCEAYIVK